LYLAEYTPSGFPRKENGYSTLIGKFNGITHQIKNYLADAPAIPNERFIKTGFIMYIKGDTLFLRTYRHDADNPFKQRGHVKGGMFQFIRSDTKSIVSEWENFAQTLVPASEDMTPLALRDHIKEILAFIANDIESAQTESEQIEKSHGEKPRKLNPSAAETHAALRHAGGFNMDQMVSEYRALRASVIKLWGAQLTAATDLDISDLTRFNESIDQALTESICDYTKKTRSFQKLVFRHLKP